MSLHPYAFKGDNEGPQTPTDNKDVVKNTERVINNLQIAFAALQRLPGPTKPIWITEIGWPVGGGGAKPDGSHLLVGQQMQHDLLKSSFEAIRGESTQSLLRNPHVENLSYYNVQDWVNDVPSGLEASSWEFHCGLVEEQGGGEHGKTRQAFNAFRELAE